MCTTWVCDERQPPRTDARDGRVYLAATAAVVEVVSVRWSVEDLPSTSLKEIQVNNPEELVGFLVCRHLGVQHMARC